MHHTQNSPYGMGASSRRFGPRAAYAHNASEHIAAPRARMEQSDIARPERVWSKAT